MLKKIEIENFKNFNKKFVFDLSKIKNYEFNKEVIKNDLINKAIIYGHNGSGKSNLGFAIFDIISNLTDKNINKAQYVNYLNASSDKEYAQFSFEFKFGDDIVIYNYEKETIEKIIKEELFINGTKVVSYDRRTDQNVFIDLEGAENLVKDLSKINISVLKYIKTNTILNDNNKNNVLFELFDFIDGMLFFRSLDKNMYIGFENGSKKLLEYIIEINKVKAFEEFLNKSGIKCKLKKIKNNDRETIVFNYKKRNIDFDDIASTGTMSLTLLYYWLQKMDECSLVFIDEFDAFYHHELAELIIEELKKKEPQIIITTHNTSIINNDLLRVDCYFQIKEDSIRPMYEGTNKEIREGHNLEKMYRTGVFDEKQ